MIFKSFLTFAGVVILLAQADSCFQKRDSEMTRIEIVEGDKGLLIYFIKDIDPNAPYEFGNTVLSEPHPGGQGFNPLPNFGAVCVDSHKGTSGSGRKVSRKCDDTTNCLH